ncbi:hypothetical protein ACF08B_02810 [Streptomyces sp. NPDC015139]|uniref:hypothetical protein n=1 Tax=Streptomyces sp. NPDC015139 TaxID=3364942 RepID=UPI0036FECF5E
MPAHLARFAGTHASWTAPGIGVEDLVMARLAAVDGRTPWESFLELDETLTRIGEGADRRPAYQVSHPRTRR